MHYQFSDIFELHPEAKTLLDLGCGKGIFSLYAAARELKVDALDIDEALPDALRHVQNVTFESVDLSTWKPKKTWDIIVAHHVIQFLEKEYALQVFLPSLVEHLNPNGVLEIFTFTPDETLDVPTKYTLREILGALPGLDILKGETFSFDKMHPKVGQHTFHEHWILARKK